MSWVDTRRIVRSGFINFSRNGVISLASVLVMVITLCVITSIFLSQAILTTTLASIQNKVDVNVYFVPGADESAILNLQSNLEQLPQVASVTYTSAAQALTNFTTLHANDYLTLQALQELNQNPLGATLAIKAKDPSQYDSIAQFLQSDSALSSDGTSIIDKVNYYQNEDVINRFSDIIHGARRLGLIVTFVLVIISILITFNTVRLTIYMAREEIGVMRLVGAANRYIQGPFVVEGVIYGVLASLITAGLFFPITIWLGDKMTNFLGINIFDYYVHNFIQIFLIMLFSGTFLGILASLFAIRRYLRT